MKELLKKGFYLFTPVILGSLVGLLISSSIDYNELVKPLLAPPSWTFPVAWTIIYLLMGISYFLIRKKEDYLDENSVIYYLQLAVNLMWSVFFFTLKLRLFACIWIVLLDILVIFMIYKFYLKNKTSAYLNLPYLCWIWFATYLTIGIYVLNY